MKKVLFYSSLLISIIFLINIISILTTELDRLTDYGYGYLFGKVILLVMFMTIMLVTRNHKTKPKKEL